MAIIADARLARLGVRSLALALAGASGALLLGALYFQYVEGLAPCPLCLYQRYAHVTSLALALGAAAAHPRIGRVLLGLTGLAFIAGAGVAGFHAGVEQHWWAGLEGCTGEVPSGLSLDELKAQLLEASPARCDEIPWSLFGLSMAAWNGVLSTGLAVVALIGARRAHG
ncbi:MAG: disulfide bond formation protein B [Alphaproteobacteria bacterium]